ncbi:MAG TPA: hypothetical protein PLJ42_10810 [Chitinophagales bacterium]|jgi:hypothetical protein|nr:hypothetical protein [Chitinophagales bacterium]MBP6153405.1 hypothetical protein [Chitinophagales bacterium]HQV79132.1 hypothetical protein [Chitinophagales bacterium]HQW79912.1 hypothetical protein [Chitinophagales bacterium]HRB93339.1 hypothetical protein [Chitinophagales bacterium]
MHTIEPFWKWRDFYKAEEDEKSPFYGKEYSEFEFVDTIYNYYIHPQWDYFGSETLYLKLLYVNYNKGVAIIEFIGEWNDCRENDIEFLKRDIVDGLIQHGIFKFVLIGDNLLEFFSDSHDYYEEWYDDIKEKNGWIIALNFREHIISEMQQANIHYYISTLFFSEDLNWRKFKPLHLISFLEDKQLKILE